MYTAPNLFAKHCTYNPLDDRTFFSTALRVASECIVEDLDKKDVPVIFGSKLLKQTKDEAIVPRKTAQDRERVKRSFLMFDVDYDQGDEEISQALWDAFIQFGHDHGTPVMMYPTLSWPTKPRFRVVLLTKSLLNATQYEKAIKWVAEEVGYEITDPMDYHISPNKNLPAFSTQDMADKTYTTFDNVFLEPLPSHLWSHVPGTRRKQPRKGTHMSVPELGFVYNRDKLFEAAHKMADDDFTKHYSTYWMVSRSVAFDVYTGALTEDEGRQLVTIFASSAPDLATKVKWTTGNKRLLSKDRDVLARDEEARSYARPLYTFSEFADCLDDADDVD